MVICCLPKRKGIYTMDRPNSPLALRPSEAATMLGISTRTLSKWTKEGRIPSVRVGSTRGTVLYPLADLQEWLSREANAAKPAVKADALPCA